MSDAETPAPAKPGIMPTYLDELLSSVLLGLGAALVKSHLITDDQLGAGVSALLILIGIVWSILNANPNRKSPINFLLSLVSQAPVSSQTSYNSAIVQVEGLAISEADKVIKAEASKVPLVGGLVASAGEKAAAQVIDTEGAKLLEPQPAAGNAARPQS